MVNLELGEGYSVMRQRENSSPDKKKFDNESSKIKNKRAQNANVTPLVHMGLSTVREG